MTTHRTSILIAPVVMLLLLASTLVGIDRLAFRDVSHFYLPLYDYVAHRTSQQWLPLWNPLDQTGMPLLGETTTAVIYPPRYLLFALPLASSVALSWYVLIHLVLASLTSRWAAIQAGCSPLAATLAGVIYPLSGGVLFLYTNPPYLVGAAWMPLALGALIGDRISARNRVLIGGPSLAMMILGGDPQSALHTMMIASVVLAFRIGQSKTNLSYGQAIITIVAVPALAACLTAPQLAASLSWSSQSNRVRAKDQQPWWQAPQQDSRRRDAFQFSLPPWHAASLLTPNALGRLFPNYQRTSALIPGDGRMWTPTLYLGMLAALALATRLLRREFDLWMIITAVSFLFCMGHFGLVWLVQQTGWLPNVDSAIGGPYWFLYQCLPGYDSFRYPVKWLPFFSLAVAICTARWVPTCDWGSVKRPLCAIGASLALGLLAAETLLPRINATGYSDTYWGPLDLDGARVALRWSLLHSAVLLVMLVLYFRRWNRPTTPWALGMLIVIVAADLGISGRVWIARVSRQKELSLLEAAADRQGSAFRWIRTRSGEGYPRVWQSEGNPDRLLEVAASERLAWFGRWHLAQEQAVINNMTSIRSHQTAMFWQAISQVTADMNKQQAAACWRSIRNWLAIEGALTARDQATSVAGHQLVDIDFRSKPYPRYQFHINWKTGQAEDVEVFAGLLGDLAAQSAQPLVHDNDVPDSTGNADEAEVTIDPIADDHVRVTTNALGLLTRPVFQDRHWLAEVRSTDSDAWQRAEVHRVSFLTQGVIMKPGTWEVRFRYAPFWLPWTLLIAVLSWSLLATFVVKVSRSSYDR